MAYIPAAIINRLYNRTSLRNTENGVCFSVKNRLGPVTLNGISRLSLDGELIDSSRVQLAVDAAEAVPLEAFCADAPADFPLGTELTFLLDVEPLGEQQHDIEICFATQSYGELKLSVRDHPRSARRDADAIPRDRSDDYSAAVIQQRQSFIESKSGTRLEHVSRYSIDPAVTRGNIEHFTGVAQVPLGFAGPLPVNGEHARGEFYVPLATSEGTLVASYNRGMKVLHRSGGVKCAVVGDAMQRAPVFIFEDASQARRFADWVALNTDGIRAAAEATDRFVRLKHVDYCLSNKFAFLRFNFTTGDAGGQNMVGKATFAACNWILQAFDDFAIQRFYLESNFATDKKASMINMMRTRGKRVTAEAVVDREALLEIMDADTEALYEHSRVASIASMLSGANNNGCHAANAITAMFLACGQDVANVSESSVGLLYTELTPEKNLYMSITLPSLIVATIGGGTGLPTQRECLQALDCYGVGKVYKFAEIVAATVLAGEISLAAAISSLDWVSSHEQLGRNDPGR